MSSGKTHMRREILEIPQAAQRFLDAASPSIDAAAQDLAQSRAHLITTVARGSSDHAASYLKYAIELSTGIPVASVGPSVASIYQVDLKLANTASLIISQSGKSPDIVAMAEAAGRGGALTIAITNAAGSPLGETCARTLDIAAGLEKSVAATKTFVNSVLAGLLLLARWQKDQALAEAIERLPEQFENAILCEWTPLADALLTSNSLYILGRGPAMAIAHEAALKFKETCQIHAEAYSSAEILHGPVSIIGTGFPVLALAARDAAHASVVETSAVMMARGADIFITSDGLPDATRLPFAATGHPLTDPLVLIVCFYSFIEELARRRGLDPDAPPHLRKVTETL